MIKHAINVLKTIPPSRGRRLVLCCLREGLDVFFIETPIVIRGRSPMDRLREFLQRTIRAMSEPSAAALAHFLHLPTRVADHVLDDLEKTGAAAVDSGGHWRVPEGAAILGKDDTPATLDIRCRKLLCYWRKADALLPVLPSTLRERDLTALAVHNLEDEARDAYERIRSWAGEEGVRRGKPESFTILPPPPVIHSRPPDETTPATGPGSENPVTTPSPESLAHDSVHVRQCQIDVICLSWIRRDGPIWTLQSRLWCRTRDPEDENENGHFTPGDPFAGLPILERLMEYDIPDASNSARELMSLFDPRDDVWRTLIASDAERGRVRQPIEDDPDDCMLLDPDVPDSNARWKLLDTTLGDHLKLLCRNSQAR